MLEFFRQCFSLALDEEGEFFAEGQFRRIAELDGGADATPPRRGEPQDVANLCTLTVLDRSKKRCLTKYHAKLKHCPFFQTFSAIPLTRSQIHG